MGPAKYNRNLLSSAALALFPLLATFSYAQASPAVATKSTLTLVQAEAIAVAHQPTILAARLRARAASERTSEQRAGFLPTVNFNATGALVADPSTATAAGALTTSSISDRFAYGGTLVQLITDFGRTSALVSSARASAQAANDQAMLTGAQIRLNVRGAYYQVLGAEAVLRAAREAQANRQLILKQVSALAQSQLRSTLDVNFAGVLESQAELAVVQAETGVQEQRARLATAMGESQPVSAPLAQEPLPSLLPANPEALLTEALQERADLNAARADQLAADKFATAERRLSYPSLNALGAAGQIPYHDHTLQGDYAAAGFNLDIPVFNGGLFAARRREAALNANARARDVQQDTLVVNEQVRDSWYEAQEAFRSLAVTQRLVAQSREALRLAQARYEAGLGSIVELNEAQLNETSAEISAADATYTYLSRRATLDYAVGLLN
jgi:outer membrane protein